MRTLIKDIYYPSRSYNFRLWHLTDLHIGHAACDEAALRRDVATIAADPNAFWTGGGDYIDAVSRNDKRHRESTFADWLHGENDVIAAQVHRVVDILKPIAGKCLGLATGNHEDYCHREGRDPYQEIVRWIANYAGKEMAELALGWEGFIVLRFRRGTPDNYGGTEQITVYTHHGAGGGRKQGGHALRMEEVLLHYAADLVLLGHRHIRQVVEKTVIEPDEFEGSRLRSRIGVWCGAYLNPYIKDTSRPIPRANYPQFKQLMPSTVGTVPIWIKPDIRSIVPLMTPQAGMLMQRMTDGIGQAQHAA